VFRPLGMWLVGHDNGFCSIAGTPACGQFGPCPCDHIFIVLDEPTVVHGVRAMRCVPCGAEMRLVQVVGEDTMMVPGYEHHIFECLACREVERRLTFNRNRRSPTGRIVQIDCSADEATHVAKDTKSGLVVMRNQDRERLRELCNWIGWRVVN
jgi:hypothetical protein